MIVVTLLAVPLGYVGWQEKTVALRESLRENSSVELIVPGHEVDDNELPTLRRWHGDRSCLLIALAHGESDERLEYYRAAFPESRVVRRDQFDQELGKLIDEGKEGLLPTPMPGGRP